MFGPIRRVIAAPLIAFAVTAHTVVLLIFFGAVGETMAHIWTVATFVLAFVTVFGGAIFTLHFGSGYSNWSWRDVWRLEPRSKVPLLALLAYVLVTVALSVSLRGSDTVGLYAAHGRYYIRHTSAETATQISKTEFQHQLAYELWPGAAVLLLASILGVAGVPTIKRAADPTTI